MSNNNLNNEIKVRVFDNKEIYDLHCKIINIINDSNLTGYEILGLIEAIKEDVNRNYNKLKED